MGKEIKVVDVLLPQVFTSAEKIAMNCMYTFLEEQGFFSFHVEARISNEPRLQILLIYRDY